MVRPANHKPSKESFRYGENAQGSQPGLPCAFSSSARRVGAVRLLSFIFIQKAAEAGRKLLRSIIVQLGAISLVSGE